MRGGIGVCFLDALMAPTRATKSADSTGPELLVERFDDGAESRVRVVLVQDVDVHALNLHRLQTGLNVLVDGRRVHRSAWTCA